MRVNYRSRGFAFCALIFDIMFYSEVDMVKYIKKEALVKGWSTDKKYVLTQANGTKILLREASVIKSKRIKEALKVMEYAKKNGVPLCSPLLFEENDKLVKSYFSWIEGEDLKDAINMFDKQTQYDLGLDAGAYLKVIHRAPLDLESFDWEAKFLKKIEAKKAIYSLSSIKYEDDLFFLESIEKYKYLLKNRPITPQHGDYHIGNMMIENGKVIIIDFDRFDYGDPWEEFNRIVWSAQTSPYFASGIVDAYFSHDIPIEFWKLLLVYICTNTLSSLPWAIPFGDPEINTMINQANELKSWYKDPSNPIPSWYVSPNR